MKFLALIILSLIPMTGFSKSLSLEELCLEEVERTVLAAHQDQYNYPDSTSYVVFLDKVEVDGLILAEYAVETFLSGPYDGLARTDYSISYSLQEQQCTVEDPVIIKEYDIAD